MKRYEAPKRPHIYFRGGYWRVTHMPPKSFQRSDGSFLHSAFWKPAHAYVNQLNGGQYPGPLDRQERLLMLWKVKPLPLTA